MHTRSTTNAAKRASTEAELRVTALAARGLRTHEIARELGVASKTVETHLSRISRKLGVRSRVELAFRHGDSLGRPESQGATPGQ